jgi:phosphoglucomutase
VSQTNNPQAGQPASSANLIDPTVVVDAYVGIRPDPENPTQRVSFGTSGHRGRALDGSFNEAHVLAISQAVCDFRRHHDVDGPLYLARDTHVLSEPAHETALAVFVANGVQVRVAADGGFTPTPAVSHAILTCNAGRTSGLADGIVITPSHNPPDEGGYKYNPTNGGPADTRITDWIEERANELLDAGLEGVKPIGAVATNASTTERWDYTDAYVADLASVIDFDLIRSAGLHLAVDPLGGAGVAYWPAIEERYRIGVEVLNTTVDPRFAFMSLDWDGKIRMDPSSSYAMSSLIGLKDSYDVAFACDTDHDRHGIVTSSSGLMDANQYIATMIAYLFSQRPGWSADLAVGKTLVSTGLIDRIASHLQRRVFEVPVGFKWFAQGLFAGSLGFAGEESAGASFLRMDGRVWTTDKDGLIPGLLAAEMTARTGRDPAEQYLDLINTLGLTEPPRSARISAPINRDQKQRLKSLSSDQVTAQTLAGEKIVNVLTHAPGNNAAIGGIKVTSSSGWFAARPSGTEDIYKIYAESFRDQDHLDRMVGEAQTLRRLGKRSSLRLNTRVAPGKEQGA